MNVETISFLAMIVDFAHQSVLLTVCKENPKQQQVAKQKDVVFGVFNNRNIANSFIFQKLLSALLQMLLHIRQC